MIINCLWHTGICLAIRATNLHVGYAYLQMTIPVVTISNQGYIPFMENLRESIRRSGIEWQLIVLCMDAQTASYCSEKNIPHLLCPTTVSQEFINWKDHSKETVNGVLLQKLDCLLYFMNTQGHTKEFIYIDGDIAVFKDFVPYVIEYSRNYDMVFQCDEWNTIPDCNHRYPGRVCGYACTGFMYLKNIERVRTILNYHQHMQSEYVKSFHDQEYLNIMLKHPAAVSVFRSIGWNTFPRNTIPNGSYRDSFTTDAYLLHYNFLIGSSKKEEMKKRGHWFIDSE
jgi:hypothetical protein